MSGYDRIALGTICSDTDKQDSTQAICLDIFLEGVYVKMAQLS